MDLTKLIDIDSYLDLDLYLSESGVQHCKSYPPLRLPGYTAPVLFQPISPLLAEPPPSILQLQTCHTTIY